MHIKLHRIFNCDILLGSGISVDTRIENIIEKLKNLYDIDTNKNELIVFITRKLLITENYDQEYGYVINIKPSESLLRKFEKDYPELVI